MAGNTSHPGRQRHLAARWRCSAPSTSDHRRLTLTELAERAGLPVPTAHRLVGELVAWGALARDADRASTSSAGGCGTSGCSRRCRPGCASWPRRTSTTSTAPRSPPCTSRCATAPRCSTSTGSSGHASVPVVSTIGSRLPLHATGVGKVLLAHAPAGRAGRGAGRPDPGHAVHDHPAGHAAPPARPGAARRLRDDGRGDEPGRLLGRRCRSARGDEVVAALGIVVPEPEAATGRGWSPRCRSPRRASAAASATDFRSAEASVAAAGGALTRGPLTGRRRCAPRSPSSAPARPACCCPTCSRAEGIESVVVETRSAGVRRRPDPGRHPRAVDRRPAARRSGSATGCDREGDEHRGIYLQWPRRAPPPRLRRPDRPLGLGLRPDRGAEGPRRRPGRRRPARSTTRSPTPRCTTSTPTARR